MTTAVRTWNSTRTKATVTVTLPDGRVKSLGGTRAARAEAALVYERRDTGQWDVLGLRGDAGAAQVEAYRISSATTMRHGGALLEITPTPAQAVPVMEVFG